MNTRGLLTKMRTTRIIGVFLALLLAYGAVSYSPRASSTKLNAVDLGGVTGATNNTTLAYDRYILIAPFWPSTGIADNGDIDPSLLDNNFLYLIDTTKPDSPPISKRLGSGDLASNTVFFPTRVVFDPNSSIVYVRGTRFDEDRMPVDVIAYVRLDLDGNGKAVFDSNVVPIDIQGVTTPHTGEAPLDFAFGANGDLMVFTNGASIFSFNLAEGYLNRAEIVGESDYGANDSISFLDVDSATNIVSVCENQRWVGKDKVARIASRLSFYRLGEHGTFDLLKRTEPGFSPDGQALSDGSNIRIVSDGDSEFALFVTNDGSLNTVDLGSDGVSGAVKRLYTFPDLALASVADPNPLLVQYDPAKRAIGVVKPGFIIQISRPVNARPGRISRPVNLHVASETPVFAMAKLNKKNKVVSANAFIKDFAEEGGLSNFVIGQDSQWLISTYSGKLYSVGVEGDLENSTLQLIGSIGSRVDRFDYYADRASVVAISAFTLNDDGMRIDSPGSLVFGKISDLQSQPGSIVQALLPTASMLGRSTPTIRRPCNIRR